MVSGRLLFATRNAGKQREIREILRDPPFEIVFPDGVGLFERAEEQTLETTETFEGNARQKAEYFARRSGLPTAAEDSGISMPRDPLMTSEKMIQDKPKVVQGFVNATLRGWTSAAMVASHSSRADSRS